MISITIGCINIFGLVTQQYLGNINDQKSDDDDDVDDDDDDVADDDDADDDVNDDDDDAVVDDDAYNDRFKMKLQSVKISIALDSTRHPLTDVKSEK